MISSALMTEPLEPTTDIARADEAQPEFGAYEPESDWPYDVVEFMGDKLNVRKPAPKALQGFYYGTSDFVMRRKPRTAGAVTGLFMSMHMSDASYDRIMFRLINPDEPDYTDDTIADLFKLITELKTDDQTGGEAPQ